MGAVGDMSGWAWAVSALIWAVLAWEMFVQHRQIRNLTRASGIRIRELEDRVEALQSELSHVEQSARLRA
jgi:hypothetical protein